jgi:hypothetical protein
MSHYGRNNIWLTDITHWIQNHGQLEHYSLYVYAHTDLAQKYSVGLQEIFVSRFCSQEENSFFVLGVRDVKGFYLNWKFNVKNLPSSIIIAINIAPLIRKK